MKFHVNKIENINLLFMKNPIYMSYTEREKGAVTLCIGCSLCEDQPVIIHTVFMQPLKIDQTVQMSCSLIQFRIFLEYFLMGQKIPVVKIHGQILIFSQFYKVRGRGREVCG